MGWKVNRDSNGFPLTYGIEVKSPDPRSRTPYKFIAMVDGRALIRRQDGHERIIAPELLTVISEKSGSRRKMRLASPLGPKF